MTVATSVWGKYLSGNTFTLKAVKFWRRKLDIRQVLAYNLDARSSSKVWLYNYHIDSYLHKLQLNWTRW